MLPGKPYSLSGSSKKAYGSLLKVTLWLALRPSDLEIEKLGLKEMCIMESGIHWKRRREPTFMLLFSDWFILLLKVEFTLSRNISLLVFESEVELEWFQRMLPPTLMKPSVNSCLPFSHTPFMPAIWLLTMPPPPHPPRPPPPP